MQSLIWCGAILALIGVGIILWAAVLALKLRRNETDEVRLRAGLQRAMIYNLAAFLGAFLGLMMVVIGVILK